MKNLQSTVYTEFQQNISLIPYLEKHLGCCATAYEENIELCRRILRQAAKQAGAEHPALFWCCRSDGSFCAAEQDVFIRNTSANHYSLEKASPLSEEVHAFIVEITGLHGNEVIGNAFKLNLDEYAQEVRRFSQPALRAQSIPPKTYPLGCHAFPVNPAYLNTILDYQRECRREIAMAG